MDEFDPLDYYATDSKMSDATLDEVSAPKIISNGLISDDVKNTFDLLDLPSISTHPPYYVLNTLLNVMKIDEDVNFGPSMKINTKYAPKDILQKQNINNDDWEIAYSWLNKTYPTVWNDENSLVKFYTFVRGINKHELISYLTTFLSSSLTYIKNEQERTRVMDLIAQVIGENSGRCVRSGFVRSIFVPELQGCIKLKEPAMVEDNIGMKTWGAAFILSKYLVKSHRRLLREPIIELGAGTGLTSIVCKKLGYTNIMATDLPAIVPNLKENFKLNGVFNNSECQILDWSAPKSFLKINDHHFYDTIILSDPIYSDHHPIWIHNMIKLFLDPQNFNSRVLIEIPLRLKFEDTRQTLWNLLTQLGLKIVYEDVQSGYDDFGKYKFLFRVYRWKKYDIN